MSKRIPDLIPYDVDVALRCAEILGPHSASALALCELKRRLDLGEDVALFQSGSSIIVGPTGDCSEHLRDIRARIAAELGD